MKSIQRGIKLKKSINIFYNQLFVFFILLFVFLYFGDPLALFVALAALVIILLYAFQIKNYNPKIYYLVPIPIFVIQGLLLVYTYLFRSISLKDPLYMVLFYLFVVVFIALMYFYAYYYRKNYTNWNENYGKG